MAHTVSKPLPDVGSFSYSWPTNRPKPQLERIGGVGGFKEMDATTLCNFDFGVPRAAELAAAMANADQMFRDGLLLPLYLVRQQGDGDVDDDPTAMNMTGPVLSRSLSLGSSQRVASASKRHRLARPASLDSSPAGQCGGAAAPSRPHSYGVPKGAVFRASKLRLPSFGWWRGELRLPLPRPLSSKHLRSFLVPLYNKVVTCILRRKTRDAPQRAAFADFCNGKVCDFGRENAVRDATLQSALHKNPSVLTGFSTAI